MKSLIRVVILCIVLYALFRPLLAAGFPKTHDGENHLGRIANYYLAFRQGQYPPRLAPSFMNGYGYPVFNYNYPLLYMAAIPFIAMNIDVETVMKILLVLFLGFGGVGVTLFAKQYVHRDSVFFAGVMYFLAPFLFTDLYIRGTFGEVIAYAVFPHLLFSIHLLIEKKSMFRMLYAAIMVPVFLLSHNIFVLFLSPFVVIFTFFLLRKHLKYHKQNWKQNVSLIFFLCVSALIAAFFWIPVVFEMKDVVIGSVNLVSFYADHFPTISQLLFSPFSQGYSYAGPVDSMSFQLGGVVVLALILCTIQIVRRQLSKRSVVFFLIVVCLLFFVFPVSLFFWDHTPFLRYAQFPWRLLGIVYIFGIPLATCMHEALPKNGKRILWGALFVTALSFLFAPIKMYVHHDSHYYFSYAETSTVQHENKPSTLPFEPTTMSTSKPILENGDVTVHSWSGTRRLYTVHLPSDQYVTEETAFFPGWETKVDGKKVKIEFEKTNGLITFFVPAGDHQVQTAFTQHTPSRTVGNTISVFSLFAVALMLVLQWKKERHE